jgi:transmembrane protein EpsG
MTFYLYYYLAILSLLVLEHHAKSPRLFVAKSARIFFATAILLTIFISGFRYNTGYDFSSYAYIYKCRLPSGIEPLFAYSITLFNCITNDPQLMFFTYSLATILSLLLAVKRYTKYTKTSFLIFLLIPGLFLNSFSIIRQSLALVLLFYALSFLIIENRKLMFISLSAVSIMFHYTAIIPAVMFILGNKFFKKEYKKITYILLLLFSAALYHLNAAQLLLSFMLGKYAVYIGYVSDVSTVKIVIGNLFVLFLILIRRQFIKSAADMYLFNMVFIGTLIINVFAHYTPVTRISYYFLIAQIVIIPKLIYSFKDNDMKVLFLTVFVCYYSFMIGNALMVDSNLTYYPKMTPYENYFFRR